MVVWCLCVVPDCSGSPAQRQWPRFESGASVRKQDGWPSQRHGGHAWGNVLDAPDPVCGFLDREITTDHRRAGQRRVADVGVCNGGYWRHSIGKYLGQPDGCSIIAKILR
jgi:hypothetical protein